MHLIQSTFHNAFRRYMTAVFGDQILLKRTAVDTHADRHMVSLCLIYNRLHTIHTADIARIDTDFVNPVFNGRNSQTIVKMNVCHQRNMNLLLDLRDGLCRLHGRHCHTDDLASGRFKGQDLGNSCLYIFRFCITHRLDRNRIIASDAAIAYANHLCFCSIKHNCSFNV